MNETWKEGKQKETKVHWSLGSIGEPLGTKEWTLEPEKQKFLIVCFLPSFRWPNELGSLPFDSRINAKGHSDDLTGPMFWPFVALKEPFPSSTAFWKGTLSEKQNSSFPL